MKIIISKAHFLKTILLVLFLVIFWQKHTEAQFTEQTGISLTGVSNSSVAWGDYDNDGDLDFLLTGQGTSTYISKIYKNNGDNTFTEQTGISLTGVNNSSVAWGDYNNDGYLDILLTGQSGTSTYVSKIYKNNGNNTFTEQTGISLTGVYNSSVAWGDYNNDGYLDILLTGQSGNSSYNSKIYKNNGNNTFTEQTGISLAVVYESSVSWGDYNNDGYLDILLTGQYGTYAFNSKIYKNNGNNTFTEQSISLTGVSTGSVAWGDYNNDGYLDILLTGYTGSTYISKIYKNNGNNTFTEQTGISLAVGSSVAWGDYNNDGNLDILLSSRIYKNNGNNTFTEQTGIALSETVAYGDYDNDGDLDILTTGSGISKIYRNDGTTANTPPTPATGLNAVVNNYEVTLSWNDGTDTNTPAVALSYNVIVTDSYGKMYCAPMADGFVGTRSVVQYGNTGQINTKKLTLPGGVYTWKVQAIDNTFAGSLFSASSTFTIVENSVTPTAVQNIMVNKPGRGLFIHETPVCDSREWKWSANANGPFQSFSTPQTDTVYIPQFATSGVYYVNCTSVKGTSSNTTQNVQINVIDLTVTVALTPTAKQYLTQGVNGNILTVVETPAANSRQWYYANTPNGEYTAITGATLTTYTPNLADFANAGKHLYLICISKYGQTEVLSNVIEIEDVSVFTEQTGISLTGLSWGNSIWGDFDNDGDLDVLVTGNFSTTSGSTDIYRNNGDNTFTQLSSLIGVAFSCAAWGDYDNDGDLDILLTGQSGTSTYISKIYKNNGNSTFSEQTGITLTGVYHGSVDWGDYNNDGYLDIILTGQSGTSTYISKIYKNNGNNTFTDQGISLTGVGYSSVAWGDYDNDGDLDILLTGNTGSTNSVSKIYKNNGNNTFTEQTNIILQNVYYSSAKWGDYDNDGDLDILLTGSGYCKIYQNNGNNNFSQAAAVGGINSCSSSVAWGDYDNDGDLDILLSGQSGTSTYVTKIYKNNGDNTFTDQTNIPLTGLFLSSVSWGDYDNDGDLDILLSGQSGTSTYVTKIYKNQGTTVNTKPTAPSNLTQTTSGTNIIFNWNKATDTETPQDGLSYNLYVYKTGQLNYVNAPHAITATGKRLIAKIGNIQWNTVGFALNLPYGDYTWSVQAIDAGLAGGTFAPIQSFTHECAEPTQVTGLTYGVVNHNTIQITGITPPTSTATGYIIKINTTNSFTPPVDGSTYTANSFYSSGEQVVYSGTGTGMSTVNITNLNSSTTYYFKVYAYNYCSYTTNWETVGYETSQTTTACIEPGFPVVLSDGLCSILDYRNIQLTSWTAPTSGADGYIVKMNTTNNFTAPVDGTNYTGNTVYGSGEQVIYTGINAYSSSVITNLTENTTYYFKVYSYNVCDGSKEYESTGSLVVSRTTPACSAPNTSSISFGGISATTIAVSSSSIPTYGADGYVIKIDTSSVFDDLIDGTNYTASTVYDGGEQVVFSGTTVYGFAVTNLQPGTLYYFKVYPYNNCTGTKMYNNLSSYSSKATQLFTLLSSTGLPSTQNGYSSWGDFDNDGDLDVMLTGTSGNYSSYLYKNNGNNTFTNTNITFSGVLYGSTAWGDYNNDGNLDLIITGKASSSSFVSKIFKNNGNNTFTEQTGISLTGVYNSSVAWGDYDNDGNSDILLAGNNGTTTVTKIYKNNGNNTFTEQTAIVLPSIENGSALWTDYDNDGDLDILLSGSGVSKLYRNDGNGVFNLQTSVTLVGLYNSSCLFGDYNNDGNPDLLMSGNSTSTGINPVCKLYKNNGNNTFTEQTGVTLPGNGKVAWGDYNNDGKLDILLIGYTSTSSSSYVSKILKNNGDNTFTEQPNQSLTNFSSGSINWVDIDNDKDLDVFITGYGYNGSQSYLYKNETVISNTMPTAPTNLQTFVWQTNGKYSVRFTWNKGTDAQTTQNGLNYNIRLGNYAQGIEKISPMSNPIIGTRQVVANGNAQQKNQWTINGLDAGTYYWSVQSIDGSYIGSEFAVEGVVGCGVDIISNSVSPTTTQTLVAGSSGTPLNVTETLMPDYREWKYSTTSGSNYQSFSSIQSGVSYVPMFETEGTFYVICQSTKNSITVSSNEVQINVNYAVLSNSIAPEATQNIGVNFAGNILTVTENLTVDSREWKYTTTSGSNYQSFAPQQTGSNYTPIFTNVGTYYVVCQSTKSGITVTSNEVQINVSSVALTNSISPATSQNISVNTMGNVLTVTENLTVDSREWKYTTTSGINYQSFAPQQTGSNYTPIFANTGTYYIVCQSTKSGITVTSNEVQINVSSVALTNSISPATSQNISVNTMGNVLTVTENLTVDSREWKYTTTSGLNYQSFAPQQTGINYTPIFANTGTFYVVCQSTKSGITVTSNEVQINVSSVALTNSISPVESQNIVINSLGNVLTVTENIAVANREWKFTTTSGSNYQSFAPVQNGTTYTPFFSVSGIYYVVCQSISAKQTVTSNEVVINVSNNVNIKDPENINYQIYPNPSSGFFKIKLYNDKITKIRIYSIDGKLISQNVTNTILDEVEFCLSKAGIYVIEFTGKGLVYKDKIIIIE